MKIDVQHRLGVSIVKPTGHLTGGADSGLVQTLMPLIEQRDSRVVLDLSAVEFVSSAGLGELVRITAQANTQGARVILAQPSPFVSGILDTTRLSRFFDVCPDVDAAMKKLGASS